MSVTLARLGRYGATGGAAAVVDLGVFAALTAWLVPVPHAAAAAFGVAALVNYALTSRFVFRQPLSWRRLGAFLVFAVAGAAVNVGVTSLGALALGVPALAAKVVGIGTAFLVNFWLNCAVVFRSHAQGSAAAFAASTSPVLQGRAAASAAAATMADRSRK